MISLNITRKNAGLPGLLRLQFFLQVLADGLAFAIRVSREVDGIDIFDGRLELRHQLLLAFDHFVLRSKVVFHVHGQIFLGQVFDVTQRALTMNCLPRYFPIVFAFAGDSTMTRDFAIPMFFNLYL